MDSTETVPLQVEKESASLITVRERAAETSFSTTHVFRILIFIKMLLAGVIDSSGTLWLLS